MSFNYSPRVVNDSSLVLCLDAANPKSYVSGSTTWNDLSKSGINGTLTNVGFDSTKQCLLFSSSGQSTCVIGNSTPILNFNNGSFSVEVVYKLTSPVIGTVNTLYIKRSSTGGIGTSKGYGYRVLSSVTGNASTIISVDNGTGGNNNDYTIINPIVPYYNMIDSVLVFNNSTLKLAEYRNGVLFNNTNTGAMTGSSYSNNFNLTLGKLDGNSLDAEYYTFKIYNRALSDTEVLQNYNTTKSRFGL